MAYNGGIKYMAVSFGGATWAEDITLPFKVGRQKTADNSDEKELKAPVWDVLEPQNL
jgi:hypothetical protein